MKKPYSYPVEPSRIEQILEKYRDESNSSVKVHGVALIAIAFWQLVAGFISFDFGNANLESHYADFIVFLILGILEFRWKSISAVLIAQLYALSSFFLFSNTGESIASGDLLCSKSFLVGFFIFTSQTLRIVWRYKKVARKYSHSFPLVQA